MKKILFSVSVLFLLTACGGNTTQQKEGNSPEESSQVIKVNPASLVAMKDVVCGMTVKGEGIKDTMTHNGKVYPFCNEACKEVFAKDPAKYAIN